MSAFYPQEKPGILAGDQSPVRGRVGDSSRRKEHVSGPDEAALRKC